MLPPMMFSQDEIEALVLGSRWVARAADPRLAAAGADALAKIADVLPREMRDELETSTLLVNFRPRFEDKADLGIIRKAIRTERMLKLTYSDESGARHRPPRLAFRDQLFRAGPCHGGMVRAAAGLSPLPHRSHHRT